MNRIRLRMGKHAALLAIISLLLSSVAEAARNCRIRTALPLSFGSYTPGSASPVDAASSIEVRCTGKPGNNQPNFYTLNIDGGLTTSDSSDRKLDQPTVDTLDYGVYKDAAHTDIWGDGNNGTTGLVQNLPPNGNVNNSHTTYGRIFPSQYPASGSYGDVLTVTIVF